MSREASKIGGSQVYLKEGEVFTLEEMMRAVMIASANDAAYAVAEFIAGTSRGFVDLMNEKAKALGMNDTEFNSVHGLPPVKGPEGRPHLLLRHGDPRAGDSQVPEDHRMDVDQDGRIQGRHLHPEQPQQAPFAEWRRWTG